MVRIKKIFFFSLVDIWFDTSAYTNARNIVSVLHTNQKLDTHLYSLVVKDKTLAIDLGQSLEKIFESFDAKSARYPIRKAEKDGITAMKAVSMENKDSFLNFFKNFSQKKGIPGIKSADVKDLDIFCAYSANELIGGTAFVKAYDKSVYRYKHGATSYIGNANDLLLWTAIKHAKNEGFKYFDLGGVKVTDDKTSYYYRHYQFKKKFGGTLTDFYTYIRLKRPFHYLMVFPNLFIKLFFKNDYNELINFFYKHGIMR